MLLRQYFASKGLQRFGMRDLSRYLPIALRHERSSRRGQLIYVLQRRCEQSERHERRERRKRCEGYERRERRDRYKARERRERYERRM